MTGPSPAPVAPWQTKQCVWYACRPTARTSSLIGSGFVTCAAKACRPASVFPAIGGTSSTPSGDANGTAFGGAGRGISYGSNAGDSCMKAKNGTFASVLSSSVHAPALNASAATAAARPTRRPIARSRFATGYLLRLLTDLDRPTLLQDPLRLRLAPRGRNHEDTEPVRRERRIIDDRRTRPGEPGIDQQPDHRRERAEQDRQLERDHDEGRRRNDRLAARHERPVERRPDRQRETRRRPRQTAHQGEHPDRTLRLIERILQLMARERRESDQLLELRLAQPLDRRDRRVQLGEDPEIARFAQVSHPSTPPFHPSPGPASNGTGAAAAALPSAPRSTRRAARAGRSGRT